jgi:hypothetical protein
MASPIWSPDIEKAYQLAVSEALVNGSGWVRTSLVWDRLVFETVPPDHVFRWKLRPLPGYSHAHSRKIRRERQRRIGITQWTMEHIEVSP